jgi:hypothetical protein
MTYGELPTARFGNRPDIGRAATHIASTFRVAFDGFPWRMRRTRVIQSRKS